DGLTRSLAGFDPVPPDAPRRAGLLPYLGGADALVTAVVPLDQVGVDDVDGDTGELGRAACPLQRGGSHLREVKALEQTAAARGHPPRRCPEAAGPSGRCAGPTQTTPWRRGARGQVAKSLWQASVHDH